MRNDDGSEVSGVDGAYQNQSFNGDSDMDSLTNVNDISPEQISEYFAIANC